MLHAATHGAGVVLGVAGLWWMLELSLRAGDGWRVLASAIYGVSLIATFATSTLYHRYYASPRRDFYQLLDHCAIYLLIAGTSTPVLLVALRETIGGWLVAAMWTLALLGILSKLRYRHRHPKLSLASYLLMGWLMLIIAPQMTAVIGSSAVWWLVAGGVCYSIGAAFYMRKQMYLHHLIWHVFVLAGATCHFLSVAWYVLPVS
jgi:hemolysin III